jgi:type I restriction enzyme S subunit
LKKAYLQDLFPQAGEAVPKVRFRRFDEPWSIKKLSAFVEIEQTDCLANLNLTPIEKEIAALLLQGMAIKKFALILKMKYDSVKYQVKKLYKKSGVESRAELLICFGLESKIYDGDSIDADHSGPNHSGV